MSSSPLLQPLHLPHLPPTLKIHIAQFTNLRNAPSLHAQLLHSNTATHHQQQLQNYAFIDATTLVSSTHLHAAIFRACTDYILQRLKTRSLQAEIVFALGASGNIAATMKGFGLGEGTRDVVIVKVEEGADGDMDVDMREAEAELRRCVEGDGVEFGEGAIRRVNCLESIRRLYKIGGKGGRDVKGGGKGGRKGVGKEAKLERRRRRKEGEVVDNDDDGGGEQKELVGAAAIVGDDDDDGSELKAGGKGEDDSEDERKELEMQVLGLMALRGAT